MQHVIGRRTCGEALGNGVSEQDSFINEVTEEVRRDKLFALMRRYGWIAVLLVVLLVGGASWNEWRKATERAQAEAAGDALISALTITDPEERLQALEAIEAEGNSDRAAVIGLLEAAAAEEAGDAEGAAAALEAVAGDETVPQVYRDLAVLKRVVTGAGEIAPDERLSRLRPLLAPGSPFRLLALEQSALVEIEKGETATARGTLQALLADAEVTEDLRRRAQQLIVALGGSLDAG
ncbi:MAG: tetratricopeptide repeat protein [Paracoccaceae bacterium]|nr:tetratricopeptide repeat protein [Paracoccaceae bacterium]